MNSLFRGIWIPIITPFRNDAIDHAALTRLACHLAGHGISGFVAGATTGEGALLMPGEQEAVFATLRQAVPTLPVVLGVSHAATRDAVMRARTLSSLQPDGLLVTPPTYVRPGQLGVQKHFEMIVEAADLPVLVYNIPYRTGVNVELETLQLLARDERVAGIKECGGTLERMLRLVHETPLSVFSGDDAQNFVALCSGAHGTIAAAAHIRPDCHVRIFDLLASGKLGSSRRIAVALQPMIRELFSEPNPAPLKALLSHLAFCTPDVRLPFTPVSAALEQRLQREWETLRKFTLMAPRVR